MIKECPNAHKGCPWFDRPPSVPGATNGCFSDTDHIVPRRLATTALTRLFINSPENKQQLCREEHEAKSLAGDAPLPSREYMIESILQQKNLGILAVSRRIRKIIG